MATIPATENPADFYDVVIVGSGMGGGTLAYSMRGCGARILLIERGDFLRQEPENWSPSAVFAHNRYKTTELWEDAAGHPFRPGMHYFVGGNTKLYGASLPRFRRSDFDETKRLEGTSPAWPFSYADLEQHYARAEQIYHVHGADDDPGLVRGLAFPYEALVHEPVVSEMAERLRGAGYTPSHLPIGVDLRQGGTCIRCKTCDGFPCRTLAKGDADVCAVRPAIREPTVDIVTQAFATRVLTDRLGTRVAGVEYRRGGDLFTVNADRVVISCGAVNSAALLLRSATDQHPKGLANGSDVVGRNYMVHNNTVMMMVKPWRRNQTVFQKTLYVNDFYERGTPDHPYPLGHAQLLGKLRAEMLAAARPDVPRWLLSVIAQRSIDWWLSSEDVPDQDSRVTLAPGGQIRVTWKPNNVETHEILEREMRRMARAIGYPIVLSRRAGIESNSHQAGTVRAGTDPATSALDPQCRSHELENLYVVDSSFFPSLPVMNPALTIAANALRVGGHLMEQARVH